MPSASEKTGISRSFVVIHKRSVWAWWALSEGEIEYHLRVYVLILSILQYTFLIHIRDHFIVYCMFIDDITTVCIRHYQYCATKMEHTVKALMARNFWNISQSVLIGSFSHDVANIYWTPFCGLLSRGVNSIFTANHLESDALVYYFLWMDHKDFHDKKITKQFKSSWQVE